MDVADFMALEALRLNEPALFKEIRQKEAAAVRHQVGIRRHRQVMR